MKLWVYCVMHNERELLPYFLRHYAPIADQVIIFDDHSDDGGMQFAESYANVEVRPYPGAGLDDIEFVEFAARTYPEARGRADWVVWPDADEFVYARDLRGTLEELTAVGVTLPQVQGWAMLSECFPTTREQIYDEVRQGVRYEPGSKPIIFNPALDITWAAGKHTAAAPGANRGSLTLLKLLHFRHLGEEWFIGRNNRNAARLSARNIAGKMGWQVMPEHQAGYWQAEREWMLPKLERAVP